MTINVHQNHDQMTDTTQYYRKALVAVKTFFDTMQTGEVAELSLL